MDARPSTARRSGRAREFLIRSLLMIISALITLLAVEMVVRTAGIGRDMPPSMSDKRYYRLYDAVTRKLVVVEFPGTSLRKNRMSFRYNPGSTWGTGYQDDDRREVLPEHRMIYRMNNEGFRDDDFTREKPPGTFRIAMVGDSFTLGEGVERGAIFADLLEGMPVDRRIEVMNFGVNGYDTLDVALLVNDVVLGFEPDLVIYGYVLNDISREEIDALDDRVRFARLPIVRLSPLRIVRLAGRRIEAAIADQAMMAAYRRLYRSGEQWGAATEMIGFMRESVEASGARFAMVLFPDLGGWTGRGYRLRWIHEQLDSFLEGAGIEHIDLADAFPGPDKRRYWVDPSDPHPNAEAHRIIAARLGELLPTADGVPPAVERGSHPGRTTR
jgi:hypothetical protein